MSVRFLLSGWAIIKGIPHALRTPQFHGLDFFEPENIERFVQRVESVSSNSIRQFGTMNPAQMLHHLNLAIGSGVGMVDLPDESFYLSRNLFRWILVDWYPEQPRGLRMPLTFIINLNEQFDLDIEKQQLIKAIRKAGSMRDSNEWEPHPMFRKLTAKEWGKLYQIHIDYHLRQFSA